MGSGAKVGALRNHCIFSDAYRAEAIKLRIVTDPAIVAQLDFPGIGHPRGRAHKNAFTDFSPEQPKQPSPPAVCRLR
jgi:hypothetical protein